MVRRGEHRPRVIMDDWKWSLHEGRHHGSSEIFVKDLSSFRRHRLHVDP